MWRTERLLIAWALRKFGAYALDAAASDALIAPRYYGPGGERDDALTGVWEVRGPVWLNPPYSAVGPFVQMAVRSVLADACPRVDLLVAVRSDTAWWQDAFEYFSEVRLLRGRVKFWLEPWELAVINEERQARALREGKPFKPLSGENTAPFPSALVTIQRRPDMHPGPLVTCCDWRREYDAAAQPGH